MNKKRSNTKLTKKKTKKIELLRGLKLKKDRTEKMNNKNEKIINLKSLIWKINIIIYNIRFY
jgi:hypothetical protein